MVRNFLLGDVYPIETLNRTFFNGGRYFKMHIEAINPYQGLIMRVIFITSCLNFQILRFMTTGSKMCGIEITIFIPDFFGRYSKLIFKCVSKTLGGKWRGPTDKKIVIFSSILLRKYLNLKLVPMPPLYNIGVLQATKTTYYFF